MDRGFTRVRPLEGGLDAWVDSGFIVETSEPVERVVRARS
jgi:hypothetical protein